MSQRVHATQTGRHGAVELIDGEVPDATARRASVVVVWCTAIIHTLGVLDLAKYTHL